MDVSITRAGPEMNLVWVLLSLGMRVNSKEKEWDRDEMVLQLPYNKHGHQLQWVIKSNLSPSDEYVQCRLIGRAWK